MSKRYTTYVLLLLTCLVGVAQQTPLYSQYVLNEFVINPSVAGLDGMTEINFTGRKQWLGREYGPETYSASVSTRLLKSMKPFKAKRTPYSPIKKGRTGRVGLGASLLNDQNGAVVKTGLNFSYAYHISMHRSQLSFGLSFIAQQFKIDDELASLSRDPGDPMEGYIGRSTYTPDAAFGVNYSTKELNLGFSVFQIFQSPIKFDGKDIYFKELKQVRQYHIMGSYLKEINRVSKWQYEPSVVLRTTETLQMSADISCRLIYDREYWGGLSYRTSGDFVILMGLKVNRIYFGYSFDYGTNEITQTTWGSHEAVIAIKLGDSLRRYRHWERY